MATAVFDAMAEQCEAINRREEAQHAGSYLVDKAPPRGKFIVFDGSDGCGKGSMIKILQAALITAIPEQRPVLTKHPGGSKFGDEIRRIMFETVGTKNIDPDALELLFLADHVDKRRAIAEYLESGTWVLADRWYTTSNPAYSYVREANQELSDTHYRVYNGVPYDMLFLMHGDAIKLLKRAQERTGSAIDGSHQAAKKWNTPERAKVISDRFISLFGQDPRTVLVPADTSQTTLERFHQYVGPALIQQCRGKLRFDRNQILKRLSHQYPREFGRLY
jgi:thymidylate kinase